MQPQSPNHPAPPEPGLTPHVPSNGVMNNPHSYTAPQFGGASQPPPATPQTPQNLQNQDYNFIFEPHNAPKKMAINSSSSLTKIIMIGIGVFLLMFIFVIAKSALNSGPNNIQAIDLVIEDQSEITHIAQKAYSQQGTSQETQNSSSTLQAATSSARNQLIEYLTKVGVKTNPDIFTRLELKSTDTQLTTAETNGTYDQTYYSIMKQQLSTYAGNLKQAYTLTTGAKGRVLLKSEYQGAQLLYTQLTSPTS